MQLLKKRILQDGKCFEGGILKVDSFINHQMDPQLMKILVQFPELGSNYLITLETLHNQDEMIVEVELNELSTDNYIELENTRKEIVRRLKDEILVTPKVKLVKKGSLPQSEGKAVRLKDLRDNK